MSCEHFLKYKVFRETNCECRNVTEGVCLEGLYLHMLSHTEGLHGLSGVFKLQRRLQGDHRVLSCKLGCEGRRLVTRAESKLECNVALVNIILNLSSK